jgi:AcrR family transcriptional regulator
MQKLKRKEMEFLSRRASILEKAEKIFALKGFHNTSVAEIASASGFAIGSLYQFFESKDDLYETMINQKLDQLHAELKSAVDARDALIGKLEAFIRTQFRFVEENHDFWRLFIRREDVNFNKSGTTFKQRMLKHHLSDIDFISEVISKGSTRKDIPADSFRDIGCALVGMINGFKFRCIFEPKDAYSLDGKVQVVLDIFLKGVGHEI